MSFNIDTIQIRDDLTQLLKTNFSLINVGLNVPLTGLDKIVNIVFTGHPFAALSLPIICVYHVGKSGENFNGIGAGGRKKADYFFEIAGIVRIVKASNIDVRYIDDATIMANNIDAILRNNIAFSNLIIKSNPESYTIDLNERQTGVYVAMFRAQIVCNADIINCS